jgi:ABC-type sugar transport system ATPase subunit
MSFLSGTVDALEIRIGAGALPLPHVVGRGQVTVGVRPEDWEHVAAAGLHGTVRAVEHHGDHAFVVIDLAGDDVMVRMDREIPSPASEVEIWPRRYLVFDGAGRRIAVAGRDRPGR